MEDWQSLDQQYIMNTYTRFPLVVEKAEGNYLYDEFGKAYLDLFSGLGVSVLGHKHPLLIQAIHEQADEFLHLCNHFLNKPAIALAEALSQHAFKGKVFFANSGTEATETAIKLIHKYATTHHGKNNGIVVIKESYHGRSLGALHLTRQHSIYQDYPNVDFPIFEVERDNIEELVSIFKMHHPSAVLFEPILGSGGVYPLSYPFVQKIQSLCKEYNTLLCVDEIQTGVGRTGSLFAFTSLHLNPDILLIGKGIGGGLPLSGVLAKEEVAHSFHPGDHGTTFGPSPLSSKLGLTVLNYLVSSDTLYESNFVSSYLFEHLASISEDHPSIFKEVRGRGMMMGIESFLSPEQLRHFQLMLLKDGFLVDITHKNVIRLLPPLTLTKQEAAQFLERFNTLFHDFMVSIH